MTSTTPSRSTGVGRVLIALYGLLALAATGRSVFQLLDDFEKAPVAYSLSALAAVVYIVATISLVLPGDAWYRVAWITIGFEFLGVILVGLLSIYDPVLFPAKTVWSLFGRGYGFVPLVLPVLGMVWLYSRRPRGAVTEPATA
ncbi:MAG: rane protein [Microbacteriaceae bacterium]|jgi:hypothetical protein|nr:rane protein [Microbacteriaceae bacterium]